MASAVNSTPTRSAGPGREFGFALAGVLALVAGLAATAASLSGGQIDGAAPVLNSTAAFVPGPAVPSAVELLPVKSSGAMRRDEANIEALADAAARRYRISLHAMRELVATASVEAARNRLDPLLIVAVMAVESHFNPIARSEAGATGLMQVIPEYHTEKFSTDHGESVLDPRTNIKVGVRVLKEYIVRGGTEIAGLQLYNGASGDATNTYANKVLAERDRLRSAVRRAQDLVAAGAAVLG